MFGHVSKVRTVGLTAILVAACNESPLDPEWQFARYSLQAVDGQPLPAALHDGFVQSESGPFHLRVEVTSGWLELKPDGGYEQRFVLIPYIDGVPDGASLGRWTDRGVVTRVGERLQFKSTYIQNVAFGGEIAGGTIATREDLLRHYHEPGRTSAFRFGR